MADQWWLYWAFDRDWWLSATQGSVGALIGFVGLFVAFKLTQWWEKRKHSDQRTMEGVATVLQSARRVIAAHPRNQDEAQELSTELILFSARELVDHPQTATWALNHAFLFATHAERDDSGELLMNQSARLGGSLMRWIKENRSEGELDPQEVQVSWAVALREVGFEESISEPG